MINSKLNSADYLSEGHGDGPGFQVENCDDRCIQHGLVVHLVLKAFLPQCFHMDNTTVVAYINRQGGQVAFTSTRGMGASSQDSSYSDSWLLFW